MNDEFSLTFPLNRIRPGLNNIFQFGRTIFSTSFDSQPRICLSLLNS